MLLGLRQYETEWEIGSNMETGEGYCDLSIKTPDRVGVIIEIKYAGAEKKKKSCKEALVQIEEKRYDAALIKDGMEKVVGYGIAFYKKNCKVLMV